jgi:hypothetical protein
LSSGWYRIFNRMAGRFRDIVNFIKQNIKPNFKEFNDEWASVGNYSYTIQLKNKGRALDLEEYLQGMGFRLEHSLVYSDWNHHSRKYFILSINPKEKYFYRCGKKLTKSPSRFINVYSEDYFQNFCFKFLITEKIKK